MLLAGMRLSQLEPIVAQLMPTENQTLAGDASREAVQVSVAS